MTFELTALQAIALVGYLLLTLWVLRMTPVTMLLQQRAFQHKFFGFTAAVLVLWVVRTGIYDGLDVHFLWLSALTLILGLRWSLLSGVLINLGTVLAGYEPWYMLGINGLIATSLPIAVTYLAFSFCFHRMPRNLFVYIFFCAFLPAALGIALHMSGLAAYFVLDGVYSWDTVQYNYLVLIPLMLFPEALLNGMTITILTVYFPNFVTTFQDKFYINGK